MAQLWEYLLSVTGAAMICGVAVKLVSGGAAGASVKMVTGLLMLLAVVSPWTKIQFEDWNDFTADIQIAGDQAAADGIAHSEKALRDSISQRVRTYILDKAKSLDAQLTVEVELTEDALPTPCGATVTGNISPYAKAVLSEWMEQELGIGKEAQVWIS